MLRHHLMQVDRWVMVKLFMPAPGLEDITDHTEVIGVRHLHHQEHTMEGEASLSAGY